LCISLWVAEAQASQNQRAIVLIEGDLILQTCEQQRIELATINIPRLYNFNAVVVNMW
jgi:hypothetical protein